MVLVMPLKSLIYKRVLGNVPRYFDRTLDLRFFNIVYLFGGYQKVALLVPPEHVNLVDFVREIQLLYSLRG
jgi:hypothetical protein